MKRNISILWAWVALLLITTQLQAQNETECNPLEGLPVAQGEVLFNYGSVTNAFNFTNRSDNTVGQPLVGRGVNQNFISEYGFWARFLVAPQPPVVLASQGDFPDRVQITWSTDDLSSKPTNGYIVKRDGAFLAAVDGQTTQFIDFNVQAGEFYEYRIQGRNQFGTGSPGSSIGFVNPNGIVTGKIETTSGNPVANATVTLEPTSGNSLSFDGVSDYLCVSYHPNLPTDMWTLAGWVKIDDDHDKGGIVDLGSDLNKNFWLHTTPNGSGKGIVAGVGDGTTPHEIEVEFQEDPDGWHHVAMVYSNDQLIVYVDGMYEVNMVAPIDTQAVLFHLGSDRAQTNYFGGQIDDFRIYDKPLTQTDLLLNKDITASSLTPNLVAYWKFDEGMGGNAFDITNNKMHASVEGATFVSDDAGVLNGGMTNEFGFYAIEGINYSEEQTFSAVARKSFYKHQSIEFNGAFEAYANLSSFDIPDTATIEITVQPFDLMTRQTILSQGSAFELFLENGSFNLSINGSTQTLGPATTDFQHLALLLNGGTNEVAYYLNGSWVTTLSGLAISADYSTQPWQLAAKGGATPTGFYTGLIDEVAFFDTLVSLPVLQIHASPLSGDNIESGIDAGDGSLLVHFPLDEGVGTVIEDYGPMMTGEGELVNGTFSIIAYRQAESPHEFSPSQRVVNVNSSNTAIGNIDFRDESTVQISGVVRFSNTFCYQDSVELLVNGERAFPRIFTNSEGRFVGDFEPGRNIILTPVFTDTTHLFFPGFFEVRKINRPVAGVLFQNTTKRSIQGQMAGGVCRLSINYPERLAKIKVESLNGCYEKIITVADLAGNYAVDDLPPIKYAVSVIDHFDVTDILPFFMIQGGQEIDLREMESDTVDFIYTAPPQVELEDFPVPGSFSDCGIPIVRQASVSNPTLVKQNIRVFEEYRGGDCYLDTFLLRIQNEVADQAQFTVQVSDTSTFALEYYPGEPRISGDYLKTLTVTAFTPTGDATVSKQTVVLGARSRETTFTTKPYDVPLFILRDPPGDGSYATLETGTTHCETWGNAFAKSTSTDQSAEVGTKFKVTGYTGLGAGFIVDQEQSLLAIGESVDASSTTNETVVETCITFTREFQTSDGDDLLYHDADLFVGAAWNFEYGINDILAYNDTTCSFFLNEELRISPDSISSTFIYSRWQVETDVIPSLELIGDTIAANRWRQILQEELDDKESAIDLGDGENFTFDALVNFTQTREETRDSTATKTIELSQEDRIAIQANLNFPFIIENFEFGKVETKDTTRITENNYVNSKTVSFVLADDDPNDNFSINVFRDPVHETPVFDLVAGESMCPWEPGTLNREEVEFSGDALSRVNVPTNGKAVYNLQLSNVGQTGNDPIIYILGTVEGSNPDGAIIAVDGEGLVEPRAYQILPGETLEILLTIERGPLEYDYTNLGIFMASECMWEHSRGLGYDLSNSEIEVTPEGEILDQEGPYFRPDLAKFYQELRLNASFIEPCSPVNLAFPLQDWVVTPNDNNRLTIVLHEYLYDDPDLDIMRVQYRRVGGDGNWINIQEIPASEIINHPVSYALDWDMVDLQDAQYEVRAVAQCTDVSLAAGISRFVPGRKETRPPALLGTPQPADGILSPGDEISITFTKRIRCDQIFQADGIGTNININNLALIDVATGTLIDATISCNDDKITIVPNIANQFIENRVLRVVTNDIQDLYGNQTDVIQWEFFVNRSNLYWDGGGIDEMVFEGNGLTTTRVIRNQSGEITNFNIEDIPDWMNVFPRQGAVAPGEQMTVTFEFSDNIPVNEYSTVIEMQTVDGIEPLQVDFRVTCEGPNWSFNPAQYTFSMNLTVELDIEGILSEDRVDIIGAFVGDELRGLANIEYNEVLASNPGGNPYLAFLTVYGNAPIGETVTFQIWDASACTLFGSTLESFPFEPDGLIGEPLNPQTIHTNNQVLRRIYLHPGWNWISYNLDLDDASTNGFMGSLTNPDENAIIKAQTQFSQYTPILDQWLGSLTETDNFNTYQVKVAQYDSLTLVGRQIDPSQPIPVVAGWNWIGYLPSTSLPVTDALASLTPLNGDIIKSQFAFAQYVAGAGWIGNLDFMRSPDGYLLRISNPGNLVYPGGPEFQGEDGGKVIGQDWRAYPSSMLESNTVDAHWEVAPQDFEYGMNFIAIVLDEELEELMMEAGDELGAFVNGELRGSSPVIYFPELDANLIFLTAYANMEGEPLTFKLYDRSEDAEIDMDQLHPFQINQVVGSIAAPEIFHPEAAISALGVTESVHEIFFEAYPNPAQDKLYLRFSAEIGEDITITARNILGQEVHQMKTSAPGVENLLEWQPDTQVANGFYFITIQRSSLGVPQTLKVEIKRQ